MQTVRSEKLQILQNKPKFVIADTQCITNLYMEITNKFVIYKNLIYRKLQRPKIGNYKLYAIFGKKIGVGFFWLKTLFFTFCKN
jgi:hypothetical protein